VSVLLIPAQLLAVAFEVALHFAQTIAAKFSRIAVAKTSAIIASPMTPAAGTAVMSERSNAADSSCLVSMSTERKDAGASKAV